MIKDLIPSNVDNNTWNHNANSNRHRFWWSFHQLVMQPCVFRLLTWKYDMIMKAVHQHRPEQILLFILYSPWNKHLSTEISILYIYTSKPSETSYQE